MTSSSTLHGLTLLAQPNLVRDEQYHQGCNVQFKGDDIEGDDSSLLSPMQLQTERDEDSIVNHMDIITKTITKLLPQLSSNWSTNVPSSLGVTGVELASGL